MKRIWIIILVALVGLSTDLHAQRELTVRGTESYVIPKNMTMEQAEVFAVESAKLRIIADNFGTVVGSTDILTIANKDGMSSVESLLMAGTEVKGEWIATVGEPRITRKVVNNEFVLEVTIAGKIREIVTAPVLFNAKVLRNGVTDNCESDSFRNGDYMYMSFQSPEDGYLSIYITDGNDVQCLYPYKGLPSEYMHVSADIRHLFFSKEHSGIIDPNRVDKCRLGCQNDNEPNRIYLIFSPNKYSKAVDYSASEDKMPRHLSFKEFHNWLSKLRRLDKELTCQTFDILISK